MELNEFRIREYLLQIVGWLTTSLPARHTDYIILLARIRRLAVSFVFGPRGKKNVKWLILDDNS